MSLRFNKRQLFRDLSYDGTKYTTSKAWNLHTGSAVDDEPVATETFVTTAVDAVPTHTHVDPYVYVDAGRSAESYAETGSQVAPYRTLTAAMAAKCTDVATDTIVFRLAPGEYTGQIDITKTTANQSFCIQGSSSDNCFIQGSAAWDATVGHVMFIRRFNNVELSNVCIRHGRYGAYVRNCGSCTFLNCRFTLLGSSGVNHGFERTQAQMATDWANQGQAGSNRSDGGACRIRSVDLVHIDGCSVYRTFRGMRVQDCSRGRIQNCSVYQTLESGVYLAAGDYSQNTGSSNFVIEGVRVDSAFHGGIQIIGGEQNTVSNCQVVDCANSGVILWHTLNPRIVNCVFHGNTHRPDAGLGGLGDSWGCVMCVAKTGFGANDEGYYLTALNNTMTDCGQGRADGKYAFWFGEFDTTPPAYQVIIDGNNTDATPVYKDAEDIPFVTTQYPSVVAGPSQAAFESLESDVQDNTTAAAQNTVDIRPTPPILGKSRTRSPSARLETITIQTQLVLKI